MSIDVSDLTLVYVTYSSINYKSVGLTEPSGIALTKDNDALWVVSDDKKRIFQIDLNGNLQVEATIRTHDKELEGITLDNKGRLYIISEAKNKIIIIAPDGTTQKDKTLKDMKGYGDIAHYFSSEDDNKGLEGIAVRKNSLFILKEMNPGLLIEISKDLEMIKDYKHLGKENGFRDNDVIAQKIDYADICYDPSRGCFWILSDSAKRLFLYDWDQNKVIKSFPLAYELDGDRKEIEQAEGITYNPDNQQLYIVSDKEARLYEFRLDRAP